MALGPGAVCMCARMCECILAGMHCMLISMLQGLLVVVLVGLARCALLKSKRGHSHEPAKEQGASDISDTRPIKPSVVPLVLRSIAASVGFWNVASNATSICIPNAPPNVASSARFDGPIGKAERRRSTVPATILVVLLLLGIFVIKQTTLGKHSCTR